MKLEQELAEKYATEFCHPDLAPGAWVLSHHSFLAGYKASQDQLVALLKEAFEAGKRSGKQDTSFSAFYSGYHGEDYNFEQWLAQKGIGGV